MRIDTEVLKREGLAVWIKESTSHMMEDFDKLTSAVKKSQMGKTEKCHFKQGHLYHSGS